MGMDSDGADGQDGLVPGLELHNGVEKGANGLWLGGLGDGQSVREYVETVSKTRLGCAWQRLVDDA